MQHFDKNTFKSKEKLKTLTQRKRAGGDLPFNMQVSSFGGQSLNQHRDVNKCEEYVDNYLCDRGTWKRVMGGQIEESKKVF